MAGVLKYDNAQDYIPMMITTEERHLDDYIIGKILNFVLALKKFKPSSFEILPDNEVLNKIYGHTLIEKLEKLELNDLELTKENVKRSLTEGIIIQDEQIKEILELIQSNDFYKYAEVLG